MSMIVSRTFQLTVALEFQPRKMEWVVYDATISGWEEEHRGGIDPRRIFKKSGGPRSPYEGVALRLSPRSGNITVFTTVNLDQLPPDLAKRCGKLDRSVAIPEWEKRDSFPILLAPSPGLPGDKMADPYELREEFFGLSGDLDKLTDFAGKWGLWDSHRLAISQSEQIPKLDRKEIPCIFPHLIQEEQAEYRTALCGSPERWLSHPKRSILILQQRQKPHFFVYTDLSRRLESCPAAVAVTITLDRLKGAEFRTCARPDCRAVFELESKHDQKYCKRACAHVVAVRDSRERAKKNATKKTGTRKEKRRLHDVSVSL